MSPLALRQVARIITNGLPPNTTVMPFTETPREGLVSIRLPVKVSSRMTLKGVARRLLTAIHDYGLTRFVDLSLPSPVVIPESYRVRSDRVALRCYRDYDMVKKEMTWWFDIVGDRGGKG